MEAAEVGLFGGFAVEGVKIFAQEDAGAEMIVESFFVIDGLGPAVVDGEQGAAVAEAGDENPVAMDERVGIVGVPAGFPGKAPEFAPGLGFDGDEMFGGEDEDGFLAIGMEQHRSGVPSGVSAVQPDEAASA